MKVDCAFERFGSACFGARGRWPAVAVAALVLVLPVRLVAEEVPAESTAPAAQTAPVEYSILTPALEGEYVVYAAWDILIDLVTSHVNTAKSRALRKTVEREGFKATDRLAIALQDALVEAGAPTNIEFVARPPDGKVRGLSRSDLPEDPKGRYLINVTVQGIGLGASDSLSAWRPYLALTWRLYTRDGQPIGFAHKYEQLPGYGTSHDKNLSTVDCDLPSFSKLMEEPAPLWACYDQAFRAAALALVPEIRAATPGAGR